MNFEKINSRDLKKSVSYKISTKVLNQKGEFTVIDIYKELKKDGEEIDVMRVKSKIYVLADLGFLSIHGSTFSVKK